ncbi:hypothetical protein F5Y08DRAFT_341849 [Xylaria arbuscula]|nr:hypothetical protein F5Y08DRAFT_341849 [Xylaria arbuscula]
MNPYFYSPFAGILVSPTAYSFPPRFMANHSEEYPEGYLSRETFATFFGVEDDSEDNFQDKTNTFTPINVSDLTGGIFNTTDLLKSNNLLYFVLQAIQAATPDVVGTIFTDVKKALSPLTDKIQHLLADKTCLQPEKHNTKLFEKYPGYTKSYGTYAGLSKGTLSGVTEGVKGLAGGLVNTSN